MNKPVYLGLSILDLSKTVMYEFCYYYVNENMVKKGKLCQMDTGSFIVYVKTDDIYKDIAEGVETRFGTSNYETDEPLPMGKNKQVIGLIKNELGGQIMKKNVVLRAKRYLKDNNNEQKKKQTGQKMCHKKKS